MIRSDKESTGSCLLEWGQDMANQKQVQMKHGLADVEALFFGASRL